MEKQASLIPNELREISDEDELVVSSICPRQINRSAHPFGQCLKSWVGPVQIDSWTDLPKCMKFIAKNGCSGNRSLIWARRTLDRISSTATPEQLIHILNGYADLYKLELKFIQINDSVPVNPSDIRTFDGTSSNIEQQKRHRNIAFIMHNSENSLFTSFYATHTDGHPQTCFASDDENITDCIVDLLHRWNNETSQRSAQEIEHISDNNDATKNTEESQKTDNLDTLLPSESTVQNEAILTTSKIKENDIQHTSQTISQLDFHSNDEEINTNSKDPMTNHVNSSDTGLTETVRRHLDDMEALLNQARRLRGEVDDVSSMETDDRQLGANEALKERELISQSSMTNMAKSKTVHAKNHVCSSNKNHSHTPVCLFQSTTKPIIITTPNDQTISRPVQVYDPPNVTKQPKPYRRARMLKDLAKRDCPLVQAGEGKNQRSYPEIEVPDRDGEGLSVSVRAVTENRYSHPCTTAVPENTSVDWTLMKDNNERLCLQCDPESFDPALACVYLPITDDERQNRRKLIKVRLFNWKQNGPTSKEVIARENLRLCRLEFYLCIRLKPGEYQFVSQPSYTTVIEQVDGDVTIDPTKIEPKQLCELGGEKIIIPLSVLCPKKDFRIECNGNELNTKKFTMERKKLSFTSPPKAEGTDELHLIIKRTEYVNNTSIREENRLYDDYLPYVAHDQCTHTCSQAVLIVLNNQIS